MFSIYNDSSTNAITEIARTFVFMLTKCNGDKLRSKRK